MRKRVYVGPDAAEGRSLNVVAPYIVAQAFPQELKASMQVANKPDVTWGNVSHHVHCRWHHPLRKKSGPQGIRL